MTSEMAKADIEQLWADGLQPTVEDIVKLNVLALKFESEKARDSFKCCYTLPRVAMVEDGLWFRQPTVGHEIWLDKVERWIDAKDFSTVLAINAFALSRDNEQLPNPDDVEEVKRQVEEFLNGKISRHVKDQIFEAVNYCKNGIAQDVGERPCGKKSESDKDNDEDVDWLDCLALGSLNEGRVVLHGISERDMMNMTRRELDAVIERAWQFNKWIRGEESDSSSQRALGNYYRTLDVIRERLTKNKNNG